MSPSPKQTLDALRSQQPLDFPAEVVARARTLAGQVDTAPAADVEALPEALALAVLEASVHAKAPALAAALSGSSHKPLAKAARKAAYQLRSSGVEVSSPAPREAPPKVRGTAAESAEDLPALLSPPTGMGERVLLAVRSRRGGGLEAFQFLLTDEAGVIELGRPEVNRSRYRRQLKEIAEQRHPVLILSADRVAPLLSRAAALNLSSRTPFPPGLDDALRAFDAAPSTEPLPELPAPSAEDERLAERGAQLHEQPELQPWLPPEPLLRVLAQRLGEVEHSPLQLSDAQRAEQVQRLLEVTAGELFTPEVRRLYARRLMDMAELFEGTGRAEPAALAGAAARALFHRDGPGRFGRFLVEKVLVLQAAQARGELAEPGPTPVEAPPAERRSPAGLILP